MMNNSSKLFAISMLAAPITYAFNYLMNYLKWEQAHPLWCISGVVIILTLIALLIIWQTKNTPPVFKNQDFLHFCVLSFLSFTAVVSLITGLELDGMICGFMSLFLKVGEPYLRSAHGVMIAYWHGTGMYAMYLMMIAAINWNNTFYDVAIFWCGSMGNSLLVLLLGIFVGKHGITWGSILYLPFVFMPLLIFKGLRRSKTVKNQTAYPPLTQRPKDIISLLFLIFALIINLIRGLAVLQSKNGFILNYVKFVEPYLLLKDPAPFPKIQMLANLFYGIPIYIAIAVSLINPPASSLISAISLFHAGASLQGQITHIGASLHPRTPYVLRVPPDLSSRLVFWVVNLLLTVGPQFISFYSFGPKDQFNKVKPY